MGAEVSENVEGGQTGSKVLPLRPGLFAVRVENGNYSGHLIGSKCTLCNWTFFPKREVCPRCSKVSTVETALPTKGKLDSYTNVMRALPVVVVPAPYVLGAVRLSEELVVWSTIADRKAEDLKIGMDVELKIRKVKQDKDGNDLVAYFFVPVAA